MCVIVCVCVVCVRACVFVSLSVCETIYHYVEHSHHTDIKQPELSGYWMELVVSSPRPNGPAANMLRTVP